MSELPNKMASLQIADNCDVDENNESNSQYVCRDESTAVAVNSTRRVLRKRVISPNTETIKRRCKLPPKKFTMDNDRPLDEIIALYTNKGTLGNKTSKCQLETIYEEPVKLRNGSYLSVGIRKIKRTISFQQSGCVTKAKQRKRKLKSKQLINKWSASRIGGKRMSLENLIAKLAMEDIAGPSG